MTRFSRRQFLGSAAALAFGARAQRPPTNAVADILFVNGKIHTMDSSNRVVSQMFIRNGRFAAVGDNLPNPGGTFLRVNLMGRTVIPGLIDAHNHIVLVGNRPGWHTPLEHVFTIPDAIAALKKRAAGVPRGEFITTIGPISAIQFAENRLPTIQELDL